MFPGCGQYLVEAHQNATEKPYSYLFVDLYPQTHHKYRLRTRIIPDEWVASDLRKKVIKEPT